MSADRIDVLAVMRIDVEHLRALGLHKSAEQVEDARAAVAELIEAAQELADFWNSVDGGRSVGLRVNRVNAALARVGGGA